MSQWVGPLLTVPVVEPVERVFPDVQCRHMRLAEYFSDLLELFLGPLILDRYEVVIALFLDSHFEGCVLAVSDLIWFDRLSLLEEGIFWLALLLHIAVEIIQEVQYRPGMVNGKLKPPVGKGPVFVPPVEACGRRLVVVLGWRTRGVVDTTVVPEW